MNAKKQTPIENEDLENKIAIDICSLNRWETPERIMMNLDRELSNKEIILALYILESYVPYAKWIKVRKESDLIKQEKSAHQKELGQ